MRSALTHDRGMSFLFRPPQNGFGVPLAFPTPPKKGVLTVEKDEACTCLLAVTRETQEPSLSKSHFFQPNLSTKLWDPLTLSAFPLLLEARECGQSNELPGFLQKFGSDM